MGSDPIPIPAAQPLLKPQLRLLACLSLSASFPGSHTGLLMLSAEG